MTAVLPHDCLRIYHLQPAKLVQFASRQPVNVPVKIDQSEQEYIAMRQDPFPIKRDHVITPMTTRFHLEPYVIKLGLLLHKWLQQAMVKIPFRHHHCPTYTFI